MVLINLLTSRLNEIKWALIAIQVQSPDRGQLNPIIKVLLCLEIKLAVEFILLLLGELKPPSFSATST
jgi:hypothetical protein